MGLAILHNRLEARSMAIIWELLMLIHMILGPNPRIIRLIRLVWILHSGWKGMRRNIGRRFKRNLARNLILIKETKRLNKERRLSMLTLTIKICIKWWNKITSLLNNTINKFVVHKKITPVSNSWNSKPKLINSTDKKLKIFNKT